MITLYQDMNIEAEFSVHESDIVDILRELSFDKMMQLWDKGHDSDEKIHHEYCYDVLFHEWFEKVKQQHTLQQAEDLIKVK